jgi:hypothetical protein
MSECTELSTDRHGQVVIVREVERLRPLVCVGQGTGPQPEYRSSDSSQGQVGDAPPFRPLSSAERIPATTGHDTGTLSSDTPRLAAWWRSSHPQVSIRELSRRLFGAAPASGFPGGRRQYVSWSSWILSAASAPGPGDNGAVQTTRGGVPPVGGGGGDSRIARTDGRKALYVFFETSDHLPSASRIKPKVFATRQYFGGGAQDQISIALYRRRAGTFWTWRRTTPCWAPTRTLCKRRSGGPGFASRPRPSSGSAWPIAAARWCARWWGTTGRT